jgi:hypothetical protein
MPTLQVNNIPDLVSMTLPQLGKLKFTDLMSNYQSTIMLKRTMKKSKMTFESGSAVDFNVITDTNHSAKMVGIGESDNVNIPTLMTKGEVPWRHCTWNWAYDRRVLAMNREPSRIVDLLQTQRIAAFGDAIIMFEIQGWQVPSATDLKSAYGIPYWVVKSNTTATQANNNGFNGGAPTGYTTVGNINPTTYVRWQNYATQYTNLSKDDFVRKARRMAFYLDWAPLVDEIPTYDTGDDLGQFANYVTVASLEELLEAQNDDLGNDVAAMDGKTLFRRKPVTPVRQLDLDTTNPFYMINFGEFHTQGLRGEWMYETPIPITPGQHTVGQVHVDCSFNWICRNRRRNGVIATDVTMPAATPV